MPHSESAFMQGFLSDIYLRPSCYACQNKGEHRFSDLTLADYWGGEKYVNPIWMMTKVRPPCWCIRRKGLRCWSRFLVTSRKRRLVWRMSIAAIRRL